MSSRTAVTGKVGEFSFESDVQTEESSSRKRRRLDKNEPSTRKVGGESSNESGVQTGASSSRSLIFTRKQLPSKWFWRTSPDGRYFFYINHSFVEVIDTLFKKKKTLNFNFSAATVDGMPLASNFAVKDYYAFGLENSLVLFNASSYGWRVATGVLNLEQSTVVIGQSTAISFQGELFDSRFVPKSYPANLKDGFILKVADNGRSEYFDVQLDEQNQLQATRINSLSNVDIVAVQEEFAYSLDWKSTYDGTRLTGGYVELSKRSLGTGELFSYPTINWIVHFHLQFTLGCQVGNQFFGYRNDYGWPRKARIVSLNLDTLEWKETGIELHGHVHKITTDGGRNLIVFTDKRDGYGYYYRFVVNKPDSLSTCIWHNLQSIVHSRPDVYDFICSKLPTKIRPPRPIKNFVPLDS